VHIAHHPSAQALTPPGVTTIHSPQVYRIAIMRHNQGQVTAPLALTPLSNPPACTRVDLPHPQPGITAADNSAMIRGPRPGILGQISTVAQNLHGGSSGLRRGGGGCSATGGAVDVVVVPPTQTGRIQG